MLTKLIALIISQYIHTSNHHIVHLKYLVLSCLVMSDSLGVHGL